MSITIKKLAQEHNCVVISTPLDTFTAARLINQSMPIQYFMKSDNLTVFNVNEKTEDIREIMGQKRYRDFPIVDKDDNYVGMISRRNLLNLKRKQVIMVDHNEESQAVDGIEHAEILEIIDHHRLGSLETMAPVFSGTSLWAARLPSCIRCIRKRAWRSRRRSRACSARPSFPIRSCFVRLPARRWIRRRRKAWRRLRMWILRTWPWICSPQAAI